MADSDIPTTETTTSAPTTETSQAPKPSYTFDEVEQIIADEVEQIIAAKEREWQGRTNNIVQDRIARERRKKVEAASDPLSRFNADRAAFRQMTQPESPGPSKGSDPFERVARLMELDYMQRLAPKPPVPQAVLSPNAKLEAGAPIPPGEREQLVREHGEAGYLRLRAEGNKRVLARHSSLEVWREMAGLKGPLR